MPMPKLNAPAEIQWRRSNMNTRDPILLKSVEVLKDCRSLNAAAEMNCPMPRSVEKVPIRNEKRCSKCMHGMNQTEAEYPRQNKRSQTASLSQIGPATHSPTFLHDRDRIFIVCSTPVSRLRYSASSELVISCMA